MLTSGDERVRHLRRLHRLRRGARRWTVSAATLGGATAVLVPYAGTGMPDAGWAAATGGAVMLAVFRWLDYRRAAARPLPPGGHGQRPESVVDGLLVRYPLGRTLVGQVRRHRERLVFRGSAAAASWHRLDRASGAMPALAERLPEPALDAVAEASVAEAALRDLAHRIVDVERAVAIAPADSRPRLARARDTLLAQLTEGVAAYEKLVVTVAECVAECVAEGVHAGDPMAERLIGATERLAGLVDGLGELRHLRDIRTT